MITIKRRKVIEYYDFLSNSWYQYWVCDDRESDEQTRNRMYRCAQDNNRDLIWRLSFVKEYSEQIGETYSRSFG